MSWTPSVAARHRYRIGGRICIHVCGDIGGVAANREACGSGASMKLPGSNCRVWCHLLSHNGPPFRYEFRSFRMALAQRAEVRDYKTKGTSALTRFLYCGYASPKCRVSSFSSCPAFNQSPTKRMASKTNPVTLPRNIAIPRNMRRTPL